MSNILNTPNTVLNLKPGQSLNVYVLFLFSLIIGLVNPIISVVPIFLSSMYFFTRKDVTNLLILFLLVLIFADNRSGLEAGMRVNRIVVILFLFTLSCSSTHKNNQSKINYFYLLPFLISILISWIFSPSAIRFDVLLRTISYWLLPFIIFNLIAPHFSNNTSDWKRLVTCSIVIIISGHLLYLIAPNLVQSVGDENELRISGLLGNANGLALFTSFFIFITSWLHRYHNFYSKTTFSYILILFFFTLLISGSRTSLGSVLIFTSFFYINGKKPFVRRLLKYFMLPLAVLIIGFFGLRIVNSSSFISSRARMGTFETLGGRLIGWEWGYNQVPKNFWFGKGLMYDDYVYKTNFSKKIRSVERGLNAAYSGALAVLLDAGVIGTICFAFFIIMAIWRIHEKSMRLPFLLSFLISFIFESWALATLNPFTILFFIFLCLAQTNPLLNQV